ncbi:MULTISPECIES: PhzF family phenazine biosynthesis protein [unclassified Cupriavidus]|uniref:PhzF family phenazine biosynthesis protein n=1 Tax=unclassified Cupriavidus TaxID=2640874 RepID=UPI003F938045
MINVFVGGDSGDGVSAGGGNPVPLVADARGMTSAAMQSVAAAYGHESAFVLPATAPGFDLRLRFFVPQHEMEMCGHATVGSLWALRQWQQWTAPTARIETLSGAVDARWDDAGQRVWISQPPVQTRVLTVQERHRVAAVLGLATEAAGYAMTNASTSRVKTLIALPDLDTLHALRPDFAAMESLCAAIGSTGLYPYVLTSLPQTTGGYAVAHARQFPKSSGYPEDAATGIAAAALWGHLVASGALGAAGGEPPAVSVRQGESMGRPSEILVAPRASETGAPQGCWLSGNVAWASA